MYLKSAIIILLLQNIAFLAVAQKEKTMPKISARTKQNGVEIWNCSNINTDKTESLPSFYQNGVVFMSAPDAGKVDKKTGQARFELYYAETDRNYIPMKASPYSLEANTAFHEGGVTFSRDGNTMFFSGNNRKGGYSVADKKGDVKMKIFQAKRGLRDWEQVEILGFNEKKFNYFHPTLSADGRYLYFSSNMTGTIGGYDIFVAEKKGNNWSKPVNAGSKINTKGDEAFPFLHESGVLFFSAREGHKSIKGGTDWDIYSIDLTKSGTTVKNLGAPYNSEKDDLALILNADGDVGYFASSREGGFGDDDIYMFNADEKLTKPTAVINAFLRTKDEGNKQNIAGAAFRVFEKTTNGFFNGDEYFNVELPQNGDNKGILLVRKPIEQLGKPDRFTTTNGEAQFEMKADREYLIIASKDGYEPKELIYKTENLSTTTPIVEFLLKKLLKSKISGAVTATTGNKINGAKVIVKNNKNQNVETLTTNERGEFEFLAEPNTTYSIEATADKYLPSGTETIKIDDKITANTLLLKMKSTEPTLVSKPIEKGTVIVLENIYYDFDKSIIRQGAAQELDALSALMKTYQSMEVELVSHTDARGKADYNQKLSAARAESAKSYLMARGIGSERIMTRGAGESEIRNQCTDGVNCTEEEHQYNRRTDVKVLRINEADVKVQYGEKGPEVINGKN